MKGFLKRNTAPAAQALFQRPPEESVRALRDGERCCPYCGILLENNPETCPACGKEQPWNFFAAEHTPDTISK